MVVRAVCGESRTHGSTGAEFPQGNSATLLKDGYNLKKEQVLAEGVVHASHANIVRGAIACAGLPPSAINNMGKVETGKFEGEGVVSTHRTLATPAEMEGRKILC